MISGIKCLKVKSKYFGRTGVRFLPVLPVSLLKSYAQSIHYSKDSFYISPRQVIRKIKQEFYIMNEEVVLKELKSCYLCQLNTPNVEKKQKFAQETLPKAPRISLQFDICGSLVKDQETSFRYIYIYPH